MLVELVDVARSIEPDTGGGLSGLQTRPHHAADQSRPLKPLGRPKPNSDKYFAAVKLAELRQDEQWLSRATHFISQHWQDKNARKSKCSNRMALTTKE